MFDGYVDSTAIVEKGVNIGKGSKIWHFVHLMENAKIGKNCVIADYVYIGRKVVIGDNVKIENRASVFQGVIIEDNVFVGPHVSFTNDLYPRSFKKDWTINSTIIKRNSSIGAGSVIICGITLGEYSLIGAGSIVTENIPCNALAFGNPARIRGFVCECGKKLKKIEKSAHFSMICPICNKTYKIPTEDYAKIVTDVNCI
jgi:acetyltransferase-like isoleucine patch superfamily enzyme